MTIQGTDLRKKLQQHFGFRHFRPGQARAVQAALAGRDTLVLMPTGSGKSVCFQLPALEMGGTTVVVSPLIALMKDQASQLRERGVVAHEINSTLSADERRIAEYAIAIGEPQFIYTTPEQLADPEFRELIKRQPLDLFVVDEAHCISQWGHDFRPDYLSLGQAIDDLGRPPVLALTATSTDEIIDDILSSLRIPEAEIIHTGFYRDNLHLSVSRVAGNDEKVARLVPLLRELDESAIVYCATIKAVEALQPQLSADGIEVEVYHGRLTTKVRSAAQERFMQGEARVMIATNAFGLGIDKPDIRCIVHYHLPGTIEAFYQEFGRAGRDGQRANGMLLYDPVDAKLQRFLGGGRFPSESDVVNAYHALERLAEDKPTLSQLESIAPLNRSRLKACLDLMVNRRIAREDEKRRYRLVKPNLTRDQLALAGQSYRERDEQARLRQQRMIDYAEGNTCRWERILEYFNSDELATTTCGHCDCCPSRDKLKLRNVS